MNLLPEIIASLSKDEIRNYKLHAGRISTGSVRLDIELFNHLKKSGTEDEFIRKHYSSNSNAFYRLKNRLITELSKSLGTLYFNDDFHHETLQYLLLSRIFFKKERYEISLQFLQKAEKKAHKLDQLEYLGLIYKDYIRLSYELDGIKPEKIIEQQRINNQKINQINELNSILALVNHKFQHGENLLKNNDLESLLNSIIERYSTDSSFSNSYQFRFSLYQAVFQHLLQKQKFDLLQNYLINTYKDFEAKGFFSKSNHDQRLQLLTFIINSSFENRQYELSLEYSELLYDEMLKFNKLHYSKYLFFYYQSLVVNFSINKPNRAIRILNEIKNNPEFVKNDFYRQFVLFNLSIINYKMEDLEGTAQSLKELFDLQSFSQSELMLQIEMKFFRCCVMYQIDEFDQMRHELESIDKILNQTELDHSDQFKPMLQVLFTIESIPDATLPATIKHQMSQLADEINHSPINRYFNFAEWLRKTADN